MAVHIVAAAVALFVTVRIRVSGFILDFFATARSRALVPVKFAVGAPLVFVVVDMY